jgi:acetyl-CoA carboxylase biotin carboxyl carrier protein
MDIRKIKKLIELLEESGVSEIEIKEGEESVRIARNGAVEVQSNTGKPQGAAPIRDWSRTRMVERAAR